MNNEGNDADVEALKIIEKKNKTLKQKQYKNNNKWSKNNYKSKKNLNPEFFKRNAETIFKHDWKSTNSYGFIFRKFSFIFDINDTNELNRQFKEFKDRWFYTPMDIEEVLLSMMQRGKARRIKRDGRRYYLVASEIRKDLENIIRWCYKKLNAYYILYGINIDGIDIGDMEEVKSYM